MCKTFIDFSRHPQIREGTELSRGPITLCSAALLSQQAKNEFCANRRRKRRSPVLQLNRWSSWLRSPGAYVSPLVVPVRHMIRCLP